MRFEVKDEVGLLSFALVANERGKGLAAPLLAAGTLGAFEHGLRKVVALVRPSNQPSAKAFHRVGYELIGLERDGELEVLRFEQHPPASSP